MGIPINLRINSLCYRCSQALLHGWSCLFKKHQIACKGTIHDNWLKKSTFIGHDNEFKLSYSKENKDLFQHFCVHVQGSMLSFLPVAQLIRLLMRLTSTKWTKMIIKKSQFYKKNREVRQKKLYQLYNKIHQEEIQ